MPKKDTTVGTNEKDLLIVASYMPRGKAIILSKKLACFLTPGFGSFRASFASAHHFLAKISDFRRGYGATQEDSLRTLGSGREVVSPPNPGLRKKGFSVKRFSRVYINLTTRTENRMPMMPAD